MKLQKTLSQVAVLSVASAHSIFTYFEAEGTTYPASYGIRDPNYDGPINDVTTDYMACNGGPNPTTASPYVITVKAGDTVNAIWRHTLTSTEENDSIYVIDPSHKGPTLAYLKKVDNALTDDGVGDGWFKIEAAGLTNVATQDWAITDLIANQGNQSITIPTCIESGQYLLRAELIALHAASATLGAQFYMECVQLNIIGGAGTATPSTVAFPGAYGQSDPGILINIYQTLTTYTIPGPTPFVCGAGGSSPTTASSSTSSARATSTSSTLKASSTTLTTSVKPSTTTSSSKTATSTATSGTGSALYGQCGGTGWTGPTTCASGTCTFSSAYYSQCLPA